MAAAISPADTSLNPIISLTLEFRSQDILASALEVGRASGGLNAIFAHALSPLCEIDEKGINRFQCTLVTSDARERAIAGGNFIGRPKKIFQEIEALDQDGDLVKVASRPR
jgi:hypothetical protein